MDHTKQNLPDVRHRMLLHNSWGIYLAEKVFGTFLLNSNGAEVSVRDVAEQHVMDDLGFIPTLERCFKGLPLDKWMGGPSKKKKFINFD